MGAAASTSGIALKTAAALDCTLPEKTQKDLEALAAKLDVLREQTRAALEERTRSNADKLRTAGGAGSKAEHSSDGDAVGGDGGIEEPPNAATDSAVPDQGADGEAGNVDAGKDQLEPDAEDNAEEAEVATSGGGAGDAPDEVAGPPEEVLPSE